MPAKRGDIILAFVPHIGQAGGKVRPAVVVLSDRNNLRLNETIIAAISSNTSRVHEPTQMLIDVSTPDGLASGLLHNSAIRGERLHSVARADIGRVIGHLTDALIFELNACLKAALEIP